MTAWEKNRDLTLTSINNQLINCPNFFDWDLCNDKCILCPLCSTLEDIHDINQLTKDHSFLSVLCKINEEHFIKHPQGERLTMRMLILFTQVGNLSSAVKHLVRETADVSRYGTVQGIMSFLETELADVWTQIQLLTEELGFDEWSVKTLGWKRWKERLAEFERKGKGRSWV